jgi:hypothetical protein
MPKKTPSTKNARKAVNAVIFIHGITTELDPPNPVTKYYRPMWSAVSTMIPGFKPADWLPIFVQWGNVFAGDAPPFRPDQKLSLAERRITLATTENIRPLPGSAKLDFGWPGVRQLLTATRRRLSCGLTDAIYYASTEGEGHVRKIVYGQVLEALRPLLVAGCAVRLHVIAHSLGNAVAHDFLYGIFNSKKTSDFSSGQVANRVHRKTFLDLRQMAKGSQARVTFGSFSSMASPMPFFVVRKQGMVDRLAKGGSSLDAAHIGIRGKQGGLRWKIFYDKDDLLGFPTRNLYQDPHGAIGDFNVSTGSMPIVAHRSYWGNAVVRRETAELLSRRQLPASSDF